MAEVCPHCGARLPISNDAYCSECRGRLGEATGRPGSDDTLLSGGRFVRGRHAAEYFTMPGRMLVLTTIVLAVGGPWVVFLWLHDTLTPGRYPLWFFAAPIWVALGIGFALVTALLRRLGISIVRQSEESGGLDGNTDKTIESS